MYPLGYLAFVQFLFRFGSDKRFIHVPQQWRERVCFDVVPLSPVKYQNLMNNQESDEEGGSLPSTDRVAALEPPSPSSSPPRQLTDDADDVAPPRPQRRSDTRTNPTATTATETKELQEESATTRRPKEVLSKDNFEPPMDPCLSTSSRIHNHSRGVLGKARPQLPSTTAKAVTAESVVVVKEPESRRRWIRNQDNNSINHNHFLQSLGR